MEIRHPCNNKTQKRKRGFWSPHEDEKLYNFITRFGVTSWSSLPKQAGLERCEKSCRLRWLNYLNPELKKEPISQEEEDLIITLHMKFGNRWSQIAESLPGRTDNEIKNYYNCHIKKKNLKHNLVLSKYKLPKENLVHDSNNIPVTQPTSYGLQFQSTGMKESKANKISDTHLNSNVACSMMNYSEIESLNEHKRCKSNYFNFQSATDKELLIRSDCKEMHEESAEVKSLEEYINSLSMLLC